VGTRVPDSAALKHERLTSTSSTASTHQRVSANSSCGPLTFAANGEILILSSAEQFCPAMLTLFSPSCAFIHLFTGSCLLRIRNS
jgi:hypothetical protein